LTATSLGDINFSNEAFILMQNQISRTTSAFIKDNMTNQI